ncbi:MAG: methyltransferase [Gemmataceae bacterium]
MNDPAQPMPATPLEALGPTLVEDVFIDDRTFHIVRPDDSDLLLENPLVKAAFNVDEYLPYWTDLWPAARMLAKTVLREEFRPGTAAIEIGCGLGLPGIAALAAGLHVTFSDYDATALRFAAANARDNGFHDFELLQLDWKRVPDGLTFPIVLISDVLYEQRNVEPIVALIAKMLAADGVCLLTDQDRPPAARLREELPAAGLAFTTKPMHAGSPGKSRVKGTLYRITRQAGC